MPLIMYGFYYHFNNLRFNKTPPPVVAVGLYRLTMMMMITMIAIFRVDWPTVCSGGMDRKEQTTGIHTNILTMIAIRYPPQATLHHSWRAGDAAVISARRPAYIYIYIYVLYIYIISLSLYISIYISLYLSIYLSIYLSLSLSIYIYTYIFIGTSRWEVDGRLLK